jgi:hypothetical protein
MMDCLFFSGRKGRVLFFREGEGLYWGGVQAARESPQYLQRINFLKKSLNSKFNICKIG